LAALDAEEFAALLHVSRETLERFRAYLDLLTRWQAKINLVGAATLADPWRRHLLDSGQIAKLLPDGPILDIGSGAGFPGLVLAILGAGPVHLVESDARKAAFLAEAIRATGAAARVHCSRIERLDPFPVAAITARAAAPLIRLLDWSERFLNPAIEGIFLKGAHAEDELTEAAKEWKMRVERVPSMSDPAGTILHLKGLVRGRD
jgi:16S rRNA (guanine527-N7)-methyltransferase